MFGIGFSEVALIALIVIVFIKPEDLPTFFRKLGRLYAQAKNAYKEVTAVKDEFLREMDVAAAIQDAEKVSSEGPKAEAEAPKTESETPDPEARDPEPGPSEAAEEPRESGSKVEE